MCDDLIALLDWEEKKKDFDTSSSISESILSSFQSLSHDDNHDSGASLQGADKNSASSLLWR